MNVPAVSSEPARLLRRLQSDAGAGRLPLALGRAREESAAGDDPLSAWWSIPGAVVELSALPGAGALSVAFALALRARAQAVAARRPGWLCALDPAGTLSAPALLHLGVPLDELLVIRPPPDRALACATRACRSGVAAVVVDVAAVDDLSRWSVPLRRLTLAAEEQGAAVLLVTSARARREGPLPCAARALVDVAPPGAGGVAGARPPAPGASAALVLRPVRHRHGLPPRVLCTPSSSVIAALVAEQVRH
ncbi:MAG: hypothetical protein FJ137_03655 [Deltaproteobacteria bacterium]|nr:hypothetical protein [Deltaproteobacteria bacterium]